MKVLFLVNGLGLGNSTRCHAVIQRLYNRGAEIQIVTSGNGLWYFSDKPEVSAIYEIKPLAYGSKNGEISIVRTFSSLNSMVGVLRENARTLSHVLESVKPDAVVTDSDYNIRPIKKHKIPYIALNNADYVWESYFKFTDRPASIRPQFFGIEMLDYFFHRTVPDLVLSPSLDPSLTGKKGNIQRIGPIVRQSYLPTEGARPPKRVTVMLSGSVFGTPVNFQKTSYPVHIDVVGRDKPDGAPNNPNVTYHGKIKDTYALLKDSDLTVVNGGFSAVSEMLCLRKPMIVVPVPRHAEQWINARTIEELNLGLMASQSDYEDVMLAALDRIHDFDQGYARLGNVSDGAEEAADAILSFIRRDRP